MKVLSELDPILHSQLRLAVVSILIGTEEADFTFLKTRTGSTAGNLSVQLEKLSTEGYISVEKSFRNKRPLTTCRITPKGIRQFESYVKALQEYLSPHE
ncbi:MAG: transcriptional regulator [Bacteroidota bacterium]